ncbi:MAG: ABC transporter permease, partial [Thermomicrobiales bacterium]
MSSALPTSVTPHPAKSGPRLWRGGNRVLGVVAVLVFLFLYLPLVVVVLYSFSAADVAMWPIEGYTLDWYRELSQDTEIHEALRLSGLIGIVSSSVAVILGTLAALAIDRFEFPGKAALRFAVVLPITLPG